MTPIAPEFEPDYAYVLAMYLGDGHIAQAGGSWVLRIYLDSSQPEIIARCLAAIARVNKFHKVGFHERTSDTVVRSYGACWLQLIPQHGPGHKHDRPIVLESWQRQIVVWHPFDFLRGLVESDGCRFDRIVGGKAYPAYEFTNKSEDILRLFMWACDLAGIHYTRPSQVDISIARRADVRRLDSMIGPKR